MSTPLPPTPVAEGEVIDGKYRVDRVLGVGGMGIVVAATHVHLDQRVALKFLLPAALSHPDVVARFAREARSAVKIQSQHVAKVLDVGTLSTGAPYMVMEYLDGEDLEQLLARVGPLPVQDAVDYVLQACEAVAEAHGYGIVHRDLKPANLFLATRANGRPVVKVLDFGISKSTLSKTDASLTKTSAIMGSPLYMSPEQMASARNVDVRSDIWALGVILYEILAQRPAFQADSMPELVVAVLHRAPDSLRGVRPDVPDGLEAVVLRCLEKEPSQRFADIAELATALAPYGRDHSAELVERISYSLDRRPSSLPSSGASTYPVSNPSMAPSASISAPTLAASSTVASWTHGGTPVRAPTPPRSRKRSIALVIATAISLAGIGAGGLAVTHSEKSDAVGSTGPSRVEPRSSASAASAATSLPSESRAEPPATGEAADSPAATVPPMEPARAPLAPPHGGHAARGGGRSPVPPASSIDVHPPPAAPPPAPPPRAPSTANPLDLKLQF
jgi:serine/threonine protein kinase